MKYASLRSVALSVGVLIGCSLLGAQALASRVIPNLLTGNVTEVSGNHIVIDGKSYTVQVKSPAMRQLQQLQSGQRVDLVLNGPPQAASSQVIGIHVHEAPR